MPQENQEEQETQAVLVLRDQKEMRDHLVFKEKRDAVEQMVSPVTKVIRDLREIKDRKDRKVKSAQLVRRETKAGLDILECQDHRVNRVTKGLKEPTEQMGLQDLGVPQEQVVTRAPKEGTAQRVNLVTKELMVIRVTQEYRDLKDSKAHPDLQDPRDLPVSLVL